MMRLKAQPSSRFHFDPLDLEAVAFLKHRIGAPWAMGRAVKLGCFMAIGAQLVEDLAHFLRLVAMGDQQRIRRVYHKKVVDADKADQPCFRQDKTVGRVFDDRFAAQAVSFVVGRDEIGLRRPGTNIGPAAGHRNAGNVVGLFHDRIVDGNRWRRRKIILGDFDGLRLAVDAAPGMFERSLNGSEDFRRVALHRCEHGSGSETEHARVPEIAAAFDIGLCRLGVRFFDKAQHVDAFGLDVAEAGFRMIGHDAEGDDAARFSKRSRL